MCDIWFIYKQCILKIHGCTWVCHIQYTVCETDNGLQMRNMAYKELKAVNILKWKYNKIFLTQDWRKKVTEGKGLITVCLYCSMNSCSNKRMEKECQTIQSIHSKHEHFICCSVFHLSIYIMIKFETIGSCSSVPIPVLFILSYITNFNCLLINILWLVNNLFSNKYV